jgi:hypothetical protein
MFKQITLAAVLMTVNATAYTAQPGRNSTIGKPKDLEPGSEATKAIERLGDLSPAAIRERLKQMREPIYLPGPYLVHKIVGAQHLPIVESKRVDGLKGALKPVLDYHERGSMPIVVLRSEEPKAYMVDRAVIIITTRMMVIANDEEIRGIVAHELAHEYVWKERDIAKMEKDAKLMRECELFCDAVAAFTLKEIGDDPASYGRVIERLTIIGIIAGSTMSQESDTQPSLDTRKKLNRFLCQRLD